jgi:hypothetical protein
MQNEQPAPVADYKAAFERKCIVRLSHLPVKLPSMEITRIILAFYESMKGVVYWSYCGYGDNNGDYEIDHWGYCDVVFPDTDRARSFSSMLLEIRLGLSVISTNEPADEIVSSTKP